MESEQPRRLHLGVAGCDPVLHHLLLGQQRPVREAGHRPLAHHVEGALADSEPTHGVVDAARAESLLGQNEPLADPCLTADHVVVRDSALFVQHLGMPPRLAGLVIGIRHHRHVANDVEPRGVGRHDEHRRPGVGMHIGIGDRHGDQEVGPRAVRGEPLVALDHPLVAISRRTGAQQLRVRARDFGLGHRESAAHFAGEKRLHPLLLLLGSAAESQQLGVA